jgi:hypothetical protein
MSEQYILLLDSAKRCLFPGVEAITHSFFVLSSLLDNRSAAFRLEASHRATEIKHTLSRHNIAANMRCCSFEQVPRATVAARAKRKGGKAGRLFGMPAAAQQGNRSHQEEGKSESMNAFEIHLPLRIWPRLRGKRSLSTELLELRAFGFEDRHSPSCSDMHRAHDNQLFVSGTSGMTLLCVQLRGIRSKDRELYSRGECRTAARSSSPGGGATVGSRSHEVNILRILQRAGFLGFKQHAPNEY